MDHDRFDYSPITDRSYDLPNDETVALWVVPNIEYFTIDESAGVSIHPPATSNNPDVLNYGWRDYGNRVGVWRVIDILDKHGIRGTAALNAAIHRHHPEIIEAAVERDWAFMGHGLTNSQTLVKLDRDEERHVISESHDVIKKHTGESPSGWLSPDLAETYATPDILAEHGFTYLCDWCNDEQPYEMNVRSGRLISVPYTLELGDVTMFLKHGLTGPQYEQVLRDQFDVLFEDGKQEGNAKIMAISLHPMLIGHPFRIKYLDSALDYITGHDEVWVTTGDEIASHYFQEYLGVES